VRRREHAYAAYSQLLDVREVSVEDMGALHAKKNSDWTLWSQTALQVTD
jgi:hypothetical protein